MAKSTKSSNSNDKFAYGLTILIFGILFLLDRVGVLQMIPYASKLISVGGVFLIAGIIFVATQPKRVLSWVFLTIGILFNFSFVFGFLHGYSSYLIPVALVAVGLSMVLSSKK